MTLTPSESESPVDAGFRRGHFQAPELVRRRTAVTSGPVRATLFTLAIPIFGEQILNTFIGLFDTWLAGRISASATSAVGLAAYVSWLASMLVMLIGTGTTALVARHAGRGEQLEANRDTNQSLTLAALLAGVLLAFLYTIAPWLARYSNMSGDTYAIAVEYLRIDAVGHMFLSILLVGSAALRGVGDMRTPMLIFAVTNTVNVIMSCVFVYGVGMGTRGIVSGTVVAKATGAAIMLGVLLRGRSGLVLRAHELRVAWQRTRRILRIGIPAAADGAVMWSGHFAFLAVISRVAEGLLGEVYFAAHIIAVRVEALVYLPAMAWGYATATMIGQSLGAGNASRAKRAGHEAVFQCGLLAVLMAALFHFGAARIYAWMTVDPLVQAAGRGPFSVLALLQPCLVVAIVYVQGLRGAGDTRVPLLITLVGVCIRIPAGYYFGIVCGWGLLGAWIGMFGDMIWRSVAATMRFVGGRWTETRV